MVLPYVKENVTIQPDDNTERQGHFCHQRDGNINVIIQSVDNTTCFHPTGWYYLIVSKMLSSSHMITSTYVVMQQMIISMLSSSQMRSQHVQNNSIIQQSEDKKCWGKYCCLVWTRTLSFRFWLFQMAGWLNSVLSSDNWDVIIQLDNDNMLSTGSMIT